MRTRAIFRGLGVLGLETGALAILHGLDLPSVDWSHLDSWLDETHPEDAIIAVVRMIALGGTYYLVATTLLVILATLTRVPALVRGAQVVSIPGLRRAIEGVAAMSIATAPLVSAAPAFAHDSSPAVATADVERYVPTPAGDAVDPYRPTPASDEAAPPGDKHHRVVRGESLWSIADAEIPASAPSREQAVARYWRSLIDLNVDTLQSGDPDLIFPGEQLQLPDWEDA